MIRLDIARLIVGLAFFWGLIGAGSADLDEVLERGELRHLGILYANFVTADGQGLDVEIVRGFAQDLGVRYTLVRSDFVHAVRDLLGKEAVRTGTEVTLVGNDPPRGDMIASGFTILPWRQRILLFSAPTFPSQVLVVARTESGYHPVKSRRDLGAEIQETRTLLEHRSLLYMERTCLSPDNYGLTGTTIELRPYTASTNLSDLVPALLRGAADFTLLDVPDALLDLQRWAGRIRIIGPVAPPQDLAAAFPQSAPKLRDAFDRYLERIKRDGTYDQLVNRYYPGVKHYFPEFFTQRP